MTLQELKAARATAGARYAAATAELHEALVDLAALDAAVSNRNVGEAGAMTFGKLPPSLTELEHPEFAPELRDRLADEIAATRYGYVANFGA